MQGILGNRGGWMVGVALAAACGGNVEVDGRPGEGGSGNAGATGTGNSGNFGAGATGATGATGPTGGSGAISTGGSGAGPTTPCTSHLDCDTGVCVFSTGQCASGCEPPGLCEDCGPGEICDSCATSTCPDCLDCIAACMPVQAGQCDSNDPCPFGQLCLWSAAICQAECGPSDVCPPGTDCVGCATGSCCGCDDCVSMCLEFDG